MSISDSGPVAGSAATPCSTPAQEASPVISRRSLLETAALGAGANCLEAQRPPMPIIDCHIHLFDQTRPQGAPYSAAPGNTEPALPARYRKLASPLGIVGAIEVEASPWIEDNLWVLEVEARDPMMVGTIGNLQPEKPEFGEYLDRYRKNSLFLGIRYGNLWDYSLVEQVGNPRFIEGLKLLQQAGLTLDTANPQPDLIEAVLRVSDKIPGLRIVIDHLPSMMTNLDAPSRARVDAVLLELAQRPTVYVKISQFLQVVEGRPVTDPAAYKTVFDYAFETFGENRIIFGSDWPNESAVTNLPAIVGILRPYFLAKGAAVAEKYFWRNSVAAYRWKPRDRTQPQLP
jgi:predicted TIM-barrel fold metal-dependent hydrolase